MARSDTRYSVYPAPKAVELIGNSAPALNQAIECWASLLARATADNSREFCQGRDLHDRESGETWGLDEWSLLAEALKETRFDPEFANLSQLVATAIEDAHRLEQLGVNCYNWGGCDSSVIRSADIDADVQKLVEKLRRLDYVHAWAIIVAVQWFRDHQGEINTQKDDWWTFTFRRQWNARRSSKQTPSPDSHSPLC